MKHLVTIAAALAVAVAQAAAPPAMAQAPRRTNASVPAAGTPLALEVGAGRVISLAGPATSVFAADPKIAEVRPASASSLFVFGVGVGRTTIAAMDGSGRPIAQYDVMVSPSSYAAREIEGQINADLPGSRIRTEPRNSGIEINGTAQTPSNAFSAVKTAQMGLPEKSKGYYGNLAVQSGVQVNMHVRIAEMDRNLTRNLGIDWQNIAGRIGRIGIAAATNNFISAPGVPANVLAVSGLGKTSFEAIIDALSQDQLIHTLAEPNLTTMSGQPASFIVGGEFPIPVAYQNNTITVEFKQYGVSLAFVPTVLDDGQINMHVRPEVSALTDAGAVAVSSGNVSIAIPALTVRRADTWVTVGSGQSFAIAGLLQDTVKHTSNAVPFLGELPVIGPLFRSDSFLRNETELVIIVTPYIVKPTSTRAALQSPDDGYVPPNDLERIVLLRQQGRGGDHVHGAAPLNGAAGFVLQ